jgi:hypothetical protein
MRSIMRRAATIITFEEEEIMAAMRNLFSHTHEFLTKHQLTSPLTSSINERTLRISGEDDFRNGSVFS